MATRPCTCGQSFKLLDGLWDENTLSNKLLCSPLRAYHDYTFLVRDDAEDPVILYTNAT
jgi:hypothetical protein